MMNSYHISDLERLAGIKAHTIRTWEKRYQLIKPYRTSTNIRYYDDEQARKLLKVSTLLAKGLKISKIAALSEKQMNQQLQTFQKVGTKNVQCAELVNHLISSMLSFDEIAFEKIFLEAIARFGMYQAMLNVCYPFLHKIGMMWAIEGTMPAQEHFASAIIRRKLLAAINNLPPVTKKSKVFLLFLPPEEWHETTLLFSDYIIRSKGYKTIYLGQNLPVHNLIDVVKSVNPTHLLTLYVARQSPEKIEQELLKIAHNILGKQLWVGCQYRFNPTLKKPKNLHFLHSPSELAAIL